MAFLKCCVMVGGTKKKRFFLGLRMRNVAQKLLIDSTSTPLWRPLTQKRIRASLNHRKVKKAERSPIPQKLAENQELLIVADRGNSAQKISWSGYRQRTAALKDRSCQFGSCSLRAFNRFHISYPLQFERFCTYINKQLNEVYMEK